MNHKSPSTSFKVRGHALRVDLLTPAARTSQKPVVIPRWNAAAQPSAYLNYLLEDDGPGSVINGGGILVQVPSPARFALHKLLISQERGFSFQTKSNKDLDQAVQILRVLVEERPGDLEVAWEPLKEQGGSWVKRVRAGSRLLKDKNIFEKLEKINGL